MDEQEIAERLEEYRLRQSEELDDYRPGVRYWWAAQRGFRRWMNIIRGEPPGREDPFEPRPKRMIKHAGKSEALIFIHYNGQNI